jgi:hypothetical protein
MKNVEGEIWVCREYHDIIMSSSAVEGEQRVCSWCGTGPLPACENCDGVLINNASLRRERARRVKEFKEQQVRRGEGF